jgi:hypothetical protein
MPARASNIPHSIERSALQKLLIAEALSSNELYLAGKNTVAGLLAKGWIVSEVGTRGLQYRITPTGIAAFKAKIPS